MPEACDLAGALPSALPEEALAWSVEGLADFQGALSALAGNALLETSAGLAVQLDREGRILTASLKTTELLGHAREQLLQCSLADFLTESDQERFVQALTAALAHGTATTSALQFTQGLAGYVWLQLRLARLGTEAEASIVVYGHDVTQWKENTDHLAQQILRDPLTGLGNRRLIREELQAAITHAQLKDGHVGVALLDLDGFKKVNDSLGHDKGDELLREISQRLRSTVRDTDIVARMGGDEFVIVLPNLSNEKEASGLATRILTTIQRPVTLGNQSIQISTSLGLAIFPQHGRSDTELLRNADAAMYRAKEQGKNNYCVYTEEIGTQKEHALALEQSMYQAIRKGEFSLHYQPICDAKTQQVVAAESLMRWAHGDTNISPVEFIQLAEENGLIHLLGGWALRTAAMQLAQWDSQGLHLNYLTVNVSPVQFVHPGFPATVFKAVTDSGIAPHRLVLEITESTLIRDPSVTEAVFAELQAFGVKFAIDDFGTGYSNLRNLKNYPLTSLKIDRSFIEEVCTSPSDQTLVSMILLLAKELGLSVVAEGVETAEQLAFLAQRECPFIQGWLIAKAMPATELEAKTRTGQLKLALAGAKAVA